MLCVIVDKAGKLLHVTSRWNHLNGGGDNVMDAGQLCSLLGVNFNETFHPSENSAKKTKEQINRFCTTNDPISSIFDGHMEVWSGPGTEWFIVRSGDYYNIAIISNGKRKFLFDGWFEYANVCVIGILVKRNGLYNIIKPSINGFISKRWFSFINFSSNGFATVKEAVNKKYNIIKADGSYLFTEWLDYATPFRGDFPCVICKNGKYNIANTSGKILSEMWFDDATEFEDGLSVVKLYTKNGVKANYIDVNGNLMLRHWAENCKLDSYGIGIVTYTNVDLRGDEFKSLYAINFYDGGKLLNKRMTEFDNIRAAYNGDMLIVEKNRKYNLMLNDKLLLNEWLDRIETFSTTRGYGLEVTYAEVENNDKHNIVNENGQLIFDDWYDSIWKEVWTPGGLVFGVEKEDLGDNLATYDGKLLLSRYYSRASLKVYDFGIYAIVSDGPYQYNILDLEDEHYLLPFFVADIEAFREGFITFSLKDRQGFDVRYTYWRKSGLVYLGYAHFEDSAKGGTPLNDFIDFCHENGLRIKMVNEG